MKTFDTILLVDDDLIIVRLNKMLIENQRIAKQVFHAPNGEAALQIIQDNPIFQDPNATNLILLDINMPVMGGFEFLEHYTASPNSPRVGTSNTVIILSSSGLQEELDRANSFDVVKEYWIKPIRRQKWMELAERLKNGLKLN